MPEKAACFANTWPGLRRWGWDYRVIGFRDYRGTGFRDYRVIGFREYRVIGFRDEGYKVIGSERFGGLGLGWRNLLKDSGNPTSKISRPIA